MKKPLTLAVVTLVFAANLAYARGQQLPHREWKGGSKCGLTDEYGSDLWKEIGKSIDLSKSSQVDPSSLPTVMKQQLIITANRNVDADHQEPVRTAKDAAYVLQESSEGGEVYVSHFEFNGNEFTQVLLYAGGNPNGLIFAKGTVHAVGIISDSDVECVK